MRGLVLGKYHHSYLIKGTRCIQLVNISYLTIPKSHQPSQLTKEFLMLNDV